MINHKLRFSIAHCSNMAFLFQFGMVQEDCQLGQVRINEMKPPTLWRDIFNLYIYISQLAKPPLCKYHSRITQPIFVIFGTDVSPYVQIVIVIRKRWYSNQLAVDELKYDPLASCKTSCTMHTVQYACKKCARMPIKSFPTPSISGRIPSCYL